MALVARKLGIGRSTLYRKLKELNLAATEGIAAE
jgi:transcriptional regulator of acetoin/glycerol metabolism